jgi:flagellar basal-body rod protein FlgB
MPQQDVKLLENLINFSSQKQKILSKNIANVGTEGYQREDIEFKDVFAESLHPLKTTNKKHISPDKTGNADTENIKVVKDTDTEMYSGVNNVNIDREMSEMAENSIRYRFSARKLGDYYKVMQNVIKGGSST